MKKNRWSLPPVPVLFLFISGTVLRFFYVLFTSISIRQHDVGAFGKPEMHYGYIEYIMNHGLLPDFDPTTVSQFAHPPLHHLICAGWMKLMTGVFGASYEAAAESLQYLTLIYSVALMYVCYRIFCLLKLEGLPLYAATAVVCFHPVFILLSGSLNNDMLSILLMALTVLFAIKWYQNGRWRELILSALFAGLALMTKQSAVFVAVPVGILFLIVLIRRIREHTVGKSIKEIVTYLSISLPIGLWFPVYNWIRWDMPLFFVYPLSRELLQYLGDRSFLSRITDFSPGQFSSIYEQWLSAKGPADGSYNEFNPFTALLKNSLFGEFVKDHTFDKMPAMNVVTLILFITGTILAVSAFVLMLVNVIRDRSELWFERIALGAFFLVMLVGYYVAAWRYPFVCTMDFRYIPLTVPVGACFLALGISRIRGNVSGRTGKTRTITYYGWLAITGLFCISSVVMYIGLLVLTSGK